MAKLFNHGPRDEAPRELADKGQRAEQGDGVGGKRVRVGLGVVLTELVDEALLTIVRQTPSLCRA